MDIQPVTIYDYRPSANPQVGRIARRPSISSPSINFYVFLKHLATYMEQCQRSNCRDLSLCHIIPSGSLEDAHVSEAVRDFFTFLNSFELSNFPFSERNWTTETGPSLLRPTSLTRCPSLEVIIGEEPEGVFSPRAAEILSPHKKFPITASLCFFPWWKRTITQEALRSEEIRYSEEKTPLWYRTIPKLRLIIRHLREEGPKNFVRPHIRTTHIHPSRWLELLDNDHRNGGDLHHEWKKWHSLPSSQKPTKEERFFFSWLKKQNKPIPAVKYLTEGDRHFRKLKVNPNTGVCSTEKDKILHTKDVDKPYTLVWAPNGDIIVGVYEKKYSHHSDGVQGAPVLAAGTAKFKGDGTPDEFTDKSGHFRITELAFIEFIHHLKMLNVAVEHVPVTLDCVKEPFTVLRYTSGGALLELRDRLYKMRAEGRIPKNATPDEELEFVRSDDAGRISENTPLDEALRIVQAKLAKEEASRILCALRKAYESKKSSFNVTLDELSGFVRCFKEEKISLDTPFAEALLIVQEELKRHTEPAESKR